MNECGGKQGLLLAFLVLLSSMIKSQVNKQTQKLCLISENFY